MILASRGFRKFVGDFPAAQNLGILGDMNRLSLLLVLASLVALSSVGLAQSSRAGMRLQFVTLHSAGGLQGEAFLPISARGIETRERAAQGPCATGPELVFEGKHPSAYVRSVRISLRGEGSRHTIAGESCPAATITATLGDGTAVAGGGGVVQVDARNGSELSGSFDWTPNVSGEPFPLKGQFTVKLPEAR